MSSQSINVTGGINTQQLIQQLQSNVGSQSLKDQIAAAVNKHKAADGDATTLTDDQTGPAGPDVPGRSGKHLCR